MSLSTRCQWKENDNIHCTAISKSIIFSGSDLFMNELCYVVEDEIILRMAYYPPSYQMSSLHYYSLDIV